MSIFVNNHVAPVITSQSGCVAGHLNISLAFVGIAFCFHGNSDTGVNDVQRVSACRSVDRAAVVLVNVNNFREVRTG